ncbi:MAG TPA: tetratricopeptide repeat protein [Azospirillaceae bacterium]|nr:tetratricopeptide repeat protein [Azospirillaceae bacterium]
MPDINAMLAHAVSRHQAGDLPAAAAVYRAALALEPGQPDALHLLGVARGREADPWPAVALMNRALRLRPDLAEALFNLGNQYLRAGRNAEAADCYRKLLAQRPGYPHAEDLLRASFHKAVVTEWLEQPLDDDDVVIYQHNAGLGDNLLYSTLPEMFAALGKRVWISDQNRVRNPEIHQLVWGCNPYVSGVSAGPAKAGMAQLKPKFERYSHILNWLTRIEVMHGLPAAHDLPKIYYRPQPHPTLSGRILVDLNSSTVRYPAEAMEWFLEFTRQRFHYPRELLTVLTFAGPNVSEANAELSGLPRHQIGGIFELCDALASAQAFITVHSGANSLAAAIRGDNPTPAVHCAVDANHYNQKCYIWRNVDYTIVESQPAG